MEKVVMKKMTRYVELSEKFSKGLSDIFTPEELNNNLSGSIYVTGTDNNIGYSNISLSVNGTFVLDGKEIYVDKDGNVKSRDNTELTRADQIKAKALIRAILSDEYDEYIKLRNALKGYFNGANNLMGE